MLFAQPFSHTLIIFYTPTFFHRYDEETFPEFWDVIYWMRQVIALIVGIVWGFLPLEGLLGLVLYAGTILIIPFIYYTKYVTVDQNDFDSTELAKEGVMAAVSKPWL